MRHFLRLPVAVGSLAGGVIHRSAVGLLVATPGSMKRLPPGDLGTAVEAIDVAPVAQNAHPDLLVAALAVVQTVSWYHSPPPPEDTGQWGRSGASWEQLVSLLPQRPPRGPGEFESLGLRPSWR